MKRIIVLLILSITSLGCATSMTTMTDARAYNPGEIQVNANLSSSLNTSVVGGVISAVSLAERFGESDTSPIEEEEYREWLDTVLLFALFKPSVSPELMFRVGITDKVLEGIDIGVKTNFNLVKGDLKLQLFGSENVAFSVIVGYAHHLSVAPGIAEFVTLTKFSRGDIDIQPLVGIEVADVLKVSGGPRLILSRVSTEHKIPEFIEDRLPAALLALSPNSLFRNEWIVNVGANGVAMLGYKYAFLALDIGLFYTRFRPSVIGEVRDYDGATVSVAGGLSFHYDF